MNILTKIKEGIKDILNKIISFIIGMIIIWITISFISPSLKNKIENYTIDKIVYSFKGVSENEIQQDVYGQVRLEKNSKLYTGKVKYYSLDGKSKIIASYKKGKLHGKTTIYYNNHKLIIIKVKDKIAEMTLFHENGKTLSKFKMRTTTEDLIGDIFIYYENGKLAGKINPNKNIGIFYNKKGDEIERNQEIENLGVKMENTMSLLQEFYFL